MNITIPTSCEGDYKLVVSKDPECQNIICESGVSPNLVLNSGFDIICRYGLIFSSSGTSNSMRVLVVGASNLAPDSVQTSLVSQIASVSLVSDGTARSFSTNYDRGYIEMTFSRQFAQGAAAGNISEVGCGYANTQLLSRALILDNEGNPTTITVLPDEFLTVHYRLRIFFPKADITQNINVVADGVNIPTVVTARPIDCNRAISFINTETQNGTAAFNGFSTNPSLLPATSAIYVFGAGQFGTTSVAADSYTTGSYKRTATFNLGTSYGVSDSLYTLFWNNNIQPFQFLFDPPLSKTNQQVMTIRVGLQLGRPE